MTINELRHLFRENQLVEAIIEPAIQEGGWVVEFRHARGGFDFYSFLLLRRVGTLSSRNE